MANAPKVLLVHGAWHASWCWRSVEKRLGEHDVEVEAIDLPSRGPNTAGLGDLHDDAAAVGAALASIEERVVRVAHSYGGIPATEAAAGALNVAHVVYVTAFLLDEGESLLAAVGGSEPDWWVTSPDGRTVTVERAESIFYNDLEPETAAAAAAMLQPQSRDSLTQPLRRAAWRSLPSTYVVCERDNAIPVAAQEAMAQRAKDVRRLDSGHSPFLSRPDDVVSLVRGVVAGATRAAT